jgi:hypothetical protein
VALPPLSPPTAAQIKEANDIRAETLYRFGNLLPEIPATLIEAAIARIHPPASFPRRATCEVDVPRLGHVHVELSCARRAKPRPPGGRATRYEFYWVAVRAQRG